jgi:hypothetical protein
LNLIWTYIIIVNYLNNGFYILYMLVKLYVFVGAPWNNPVK